MRPGEYRPNIYAMGLLSIDAGRIFDPGMQIMYMFWP